MQSKDTAAEILDDDEMAAITLNLEHIETTLNETMAATRTNAFATIASYGMRASSLIVPYEDLDFTPTHDTQSE